MIIAHDNLTQNGTEIEVMAFLQFTSIFHSENIGGPLISPIEYTPNIHL